VIGLLGYGSVALCAKEQQAMKKDKNPNTIDFNILISFFIKHFPLFNHQG
jgi:hypothetical protein